MAPKPQMFEVPLIIEASRSYSETAHSVGLLGEAETSTWQHSTLTRHRHLCPRQDSDPQY